MHKVIQNNAVSRCRIDIIHHNQVKGGLNMNVTKRKIINISLIMLMVISFSIFAVYEIKNKGIYLYPENRVTE